MKCRKCEYLFDAASPADNPDAMPQKGDISLCLKCGAVHMFDEQLALHAPTLEQWDELMDSESNLLSAIRFNYHRKKVMGTKA